MCDYPACWGMNVYSSSGSGRVQIAVLVILKDLFVLMSYQDIGVHEFENGRTLLFAFRDELLLLLQVQGILCVKGGCREFNHTRWQIPFRGGSVCLVPKSTSIKRQHSLNMGKAL